MSGLNSGRTISRCAGAILAIIVSICLGMYMLYDPGTMSRGSGPLAIAGLEAPIAR